MTEAVHTEWKNAMRMDQNYVFLLRIKLSSVYQRERKIVFQPNPDSPRFNLQQNSNHQKKSAKKIICKRHPFVWSATVKLRQIRVGWKVQNVRRQSNHGNVPEQWPKEGHEKKSTNRLSMCNKAIPRNVSEIFRAPSGARCSLIFLSSREEMRSSLGKSKDTSFQREHMLVKGGLL